MNLTFTKAGHGTFKGVGENGTTIFTISQSFSRSDENVHLKTPLPGLRDVTVIEAPDGCTKWSRETNTLAFRAAADSLEPWASKVLGVTLTVNIVDNT